MNRLKRAHTASFFATANGFNDLKAQWAARMDKKNNLRKATPAVFHLAYAMLRGKDFRRGFGETTNENKLLKNRMHPQQGLLDAVASLRGLSNTRFTEVFGDVLAPTALTQLKTLLPMSTADLLGEKPYAVEEVEV